MDYRVIREHTGDRDYKPGETRAADPRDVAHLIGTVLEDPAVTQARAEAAGKAAPKNKAEAAPKTKRAQ